MINMVFDEINTNLLQLRHFVSYALSNGSNINVIYTDIAKAFDRIND